MGQESLDSAIEAMKVQDYFAAERAFGKMLEVIDDHDPQYNLVASYLGLSQVLTDNPEGLILCRDAAGNEVTDGNVFLNLACAELASDNRKRAIDAIQRGAKVDVHNKLLKNACAMLDCRKRCCFNFLPRGHGLNRLFGRFRRRTGEEPTAHNLLFPS